MLQLLIIQEYILTDNGSLGRCEEVGLTPDMSPRPLHITAFAITGYHSVPTCMRDLQCPPPDPIPENSTASPQARLVFSGGRV
jgi:hypothetical protein